VSGAFGTDVISVDCAGSVYLWGGSIISPAGMQVDKFPGSGAMAAFGGTDGKMLNVVWGTSINVIQMNVPGQPH
jgi:hypothetical protein